MNILYIGSLNENSNSFRRFKALRKIGYEVKGIDVDAYLYTGGFAKFHHHLNIGPGIIALNKKIVAEIIENQPGILWIDNKSFITTSTFKKIRKNSPVIKIVNLITDDITGKLKYQWRLAIKNVKYFDNHFVQRTVNINELKNRGAKNVALCYRSFDPEFHRPIILNEEDVKKYRTQIGFIGTHERNREEYIVYLIQNGVSVSVTGDGWPKSKYWQIIESYYRGPSIYGEPYIKTINGMDIALHFLRHKNRDEQDSRTFEIPACGTFMLAEKSDVHKSLFETGKEAEFFTTKEQLLKKVKYYLQHQEERQTIAKAGFTRCVKSGYSHEERLKEVMKKINGF